MRNKIAGIMAVVLMVGGMAATTTLAESKNPRATEGKRSQHRERRRERFNETVKPTAEQQKQVEQIFKTHHQTMQNWRTENADALKAARQAMKEARESKDESKIKAAGEKLKSIRESRAALRKNLEKQLGEVLSDEQMKKFKALCKAGHRWRRRGRHGHGPMAALRQLDLTDDQKAKVKTITEEARKKVEAVLTPEQREKLKKIKAHHGRRGVFGSLNLTDDQRKKVREIMTAARDEAKNADTPEKRRETMKAAFKKVYDTVLTKEQQKKADELREKREQRWKNRSGRGPGRGRGIGPVEDKSENK